MLFLIDVEIISDVQRGEARRKEEKRRCLCGSLLFLALITRSLCLSLALCILLDLEDEHAQHSPHLCLVCCLCPLLLSNVVLE